jgi:heterodisulfide reductase subunit A2
MMSPGRVLVIGGGVAGMSVAIGLDRCGMDVDLVEKAPFFGGNAAGFTCKATDACVQCGACLVETRLAELDACHRLHRFCATRVTGVRQNGGYDVDVRWEPRHVDEGRCNGCGICLTVCPRPGALQCGPSARSRPFVALVPRHCRHFQDGSCNRCQEACPTGAIDLDARPQSMTRRADAVVLAAGFSPFDPSAKSYAPPPKVDRQGQCPVPAAAALSAWSYPRSGPKPNVLTHLELEKRLRDGGPLTRPSDGAPVRKLAFIQCVGSRDGALGHLWCSRVCCAAAMRMANLVRYRRPETAVTVFYIDIQNAGKGYQGFYDQARERMKLVRAIPADVKATGSDRVRVTWFDKPSDQSIDEDFDLLVLTVGITPAGDAPALSELFEIPLAPTGFLSAGPAETGIFCAGTARGPMGIAEAIGDGDRTVRAVLDYLQGL